MHWFDDVDVSDSDVVAPALIQRALTAGELVFSDGATQVFDADGGTTYVENGRPARGEWYIDDDGHFGSFWPPSYHASYDLRWMVKDGAIVGLTRSAPDIPGVDRANAARSTSRPSRCIRASKRRHRWGGSNRAEELIGQGTAELAA